MGLGLIGCASDPSYSIDEVREWSSQRSWDEIKNYQPTFLERTMSVFPVEFSDAVKTADASFAEDAEQAFTTTPPGGLDQLLERIRVSFASTIQAATPALTPGASGILVLGDFIGPDGKPLTDNVQQQIAVKNFIDALQTTEGIAGDWFVIRLTPAQIKDVLQQAGANPGQAVKVSLYEFIYDPANIYYVELLVSAEPYPPQHMVTYTGNAELIQVMSGTKVPGRGDGQVRFYYQPFAQEWLIDEEELSRREADTAAIRAARLAALQAQDDTSDDDESADDPKLRAADDPITDR